MNFWAMGERFVIGQSFLSEQKIEKLSGDVKRKNKKAVPGENAVKILLRGRDSFLYCPLSASGAWGSAWEFGRAGLCGFFVARI
jgi:hypothetical protein